jgi:cytochrome oxidase Cu insertion factor (SCO1/SenC/PrrC family)
MIVRAALAAAGVLGAGALCWLGARTGADGFGAAVAHRADGAPLRGVDGRAVSLARGPRVVVFGYAGCADRCPLTVRALHAALAHAPSGVRLTFVDVDPWHDSPAAVARYVRAFGDVEGATGDAGRLVAAEAALGMRPVTSPADVADHDARAFVLDAGGVLVGALTPPIVPAEAGERIATMLGRDVGRRREPAIGVR